MTITKLEDFNDIQENQKIYIDVLTLKMSSKQFFIVYRNLNLQKYDININIKDLLYEYLLDYIKSDIDVNIPFFIEMLTEILIKFLMNSDSKHKKFIEENHDLLEQICEFLYSSIFYTTSLLNMKSQFEPIGESEYSYQNTFYLFDRLYKLDFLLFNKKYKLKNFTKLFLKLNYNYFNSLINNSRMLVILYGKTTNEWNKFSELLSLLLNMK